MERTWITSARRFSAAYVEGVENFMNFLSELSTMVGNQMCSARVAVVWIQLQDPSQLSKIIYTSTGCRSHILGGFILCERHCYWLCGSSRSPSWSAWCLGGRAGGGGGGEASEFDQHWNNATKCSCIPWTFTHRRKTVGPHVGTMQHGCHPRK